MRDKIFISYCHADSEYQHRLTQHLKPLERNGYLQYWSDTKLKASQNWRKEIREALSQSVISVLLISADFLASDFITFEELPELINNTKIFPILIHPCYFEKEEWLESIQFVNNPETPLSGMSKTEQENIWTSLTRQVTACLEEEIKKHSPDILLYSNGIVTTVEAMMPIFHSVSQDTFHEASIVNNMIHVCRDCHNNNLLEMYLIDILSSPSRVHNYWVYTYEHIDILEFMIPVEQILTAYNSGHKVIENLKQLFSAHGWEGDGEIRFLWFPPFLKIGFEDTWGTLAFFVKQDNNGTAFIASPEPIPYLSLQDTLYPDSDGFYVTKVVEERKIKDPKYRCLRISGLLIADQPPKENETHWLFFYSDRYKNIEVGDLVKFKPERPPLPLRDFPDIKNTRNIYVQQMEKISE